MTPARIKKRIRSERDLVHTLANVYTCYGFRGDRSRIKIAMLTAYFDESGIHDGNHLCVVAGYIGNDAQWGSFIAEWIPAIKPRKNLHMKDIRNFKRAARLLARLGPIPDRHHLQRVVGGVWWKDYKTVMKGNVPGQYTDPYMLAAQIAIVQTAGYISRSDEILFLFSRQDVHEKRMTAVDRIVFKTRKTDSRVKGIQFHPCPDATVCFDAADYLAFEVREYMNDKHSGKAEYGISILGDGKMVGYIYTAERLQEIVDFLTAQGITGGKPTVHDLANLFSKLPKLPVPTKHFPRSIFFNIFEGSKNHEGTDSAV